MSFNLILSILTGYLLGSFPTAYVFMKVFNKQDITELGSKNVGALNSYKTTSSKKLAILILLVDLIKGILSVYLAKNFFGGNFLTASASLTASVFGHCYSPWLKFKGGRGLATAAGGALILDPVIFFLWSLIWLLAFAFRKHIHLANIMATILTGFVVVTSADILNSERWLANPPAENSFQFVFIISLLFLIILSRHIESIKEYFNFEKHKIKESRND